MVLIQAVTKEAINTALIALQRGRDIVIGGEKGNTVNNVTISNTGTSGKDYTSQINALEEKVGLLAKAEEVLRGITTANQERIYAIENVLQSLGINDIDFNEGSRELSITMNNGEEFTTTIPSEEVTLTLTGNVLSFITATQTAEVTLPFVLTSEKGAVNGVATLDSSGRVPFSQLPESAMEFKGAWNAETNTPTLTDGNGTNGDFYVCSTPGTVTFGTGNTVSFLQNDRVIYDGSTEKWIKLLAGQVQSVNEMSGDVVLDATNINYDSNTTLKTEIDKKANSSSLATVATSGNYNDLTNKPTIPAAQVQSNWTQTNSASKDFIKNKIPIWITSGSADDNMSPIDSVTDGSMRPVTSNAVYDALAAETNLAYTNQYSSYCAENANLQIHKVKNGVLYINMTFLFSSALTFASGSEFLTMDKVLTANAVINVSINGTPYFGYIRATSWVQAGKSGIILRPVGTSIVISAGNEVNITCAIPVQ